ncbi:hypothetical protein SODALDRAFT_198735 [Sodiomyces alkalinus F11]|uniref:GDP/GTP exchange factor Sec2 N-terminal domain-containing protein n=1 Tax=Sodiomyces alkalinus (strain CBS 110278 / VKM F-3762 / F11) TaxID=1314773 RepID=A0A3N2PT69_SODAK|nr:hypothetical protein SODALDRAFT_198735 [Sodiomyces alkalinus F11]ROT37506.1 hypothetical protein SODALDRAFT_198735 [Sodiomyces alkalinus F11]
MDSFIAVAGWAQHSNSQSSASGNGRPFGHYRSRSSVPKSPTPMPPRSQHTRSPSTSELPAMAATATSPRSLPRSPMPDTDDSELSTLPDPRSRNMSPVVGGHAFSHHPDLNAEVATLSNKLISAINYQATLDDTLAATRSELERARQQIRTLEERNATQREMLSGDVWVRKRTVEEDKKKLNDRVAAEKLQREDVEKEKKRIELELENLTTALFEEANKMVISAKEEARRDQELLQKKNDQLKAQLADTEALLQSQQDQLAQLKDVMEQMATERDEQAAVAVSATVPSSPGLSRFELRNDDASSPETTNITTTTFATPLPEPVSPTASTSLTYLIQPVVRTDLASYEDFTMLARLSRRYSTNRISSGSLAAGVQKLGLGLGGSTSSRHVSTGSTSSLPNAAAPPAAANSSSPQTPNTPVSFTAAGSAEPVTPLPSLRETKFYKRVLAEDVEPTLRLDLAPGLSWLARRSVLNAMIEGTIVVEPIPSNSPYSAFIKPQYYPCSLCGDNRKDERYLRAYRFRTTESDSAQRYPLCKYCLGRVRSTCDFLSFLRILKDGHWRTDKEDAEKAAWEESIRLREQMFWSRLGGGVIPAGHPLLLDHECSPRPSQDVPPEPCPQSPPAAADDTAVATEGQIGKQSDAAADSTDEGGAPTASSPRIIHASPQSRETVTDDTVEPTETESKRLSITISKVEG